MRRAICAALLCGLASFSAACGSSKLDSLRDHAPAPAPSRAAASDPQRLTVAEYCATAFRSQQVLVQSFSDTWSRYHADPSLDLSGDAKLALDELKRDEGMMPTSVQPLIVDESLALVPAVTGGDPDWDAYDKAAGQIQHLCAGS